MDENHRALFKYDISSNAYKSIAESFEKSALNKAHILRLESW